MMINQNKPTDVELVYNVLKDGAVHNVIDICYICKPKAINWACRSRISDLKKKLIPLGKTIKMDIDKVNGCANYQIVDVQLDLC